MGDDIGSGSVTDCLLRSFSDLKGHTQQCRAALRQKSKQTKPEPMSSPINYPAYAAPSDSCPTYKQIHLINFRNFIKDSIVYLY